MSSRLDESDGRYESLLKDNGIVEDVEIESRDGVTRTLRIERNPLERDAALVDRARERLHVSPEQFARGCVL